MAKAHDPLAQTAAHSVPPTEIGSPPKMSSMINVDSSGLSMSWKTAVSVVAAVVAAMLAWNTFSATVVRSADLSAHDTSGTAHAQHPAHEDHVKKSEVVDMIKPLQKQVKTTGRDVIAVRNGFYDQRAEELAYRAVDNMPKSAPARRRVQRFEEVRSTAKRNLEAGRPIRSSLSIAP